MKTRPDTYLREISEELKKHWPDNRAVHIVAHGHSVPSGYFATPFVDTFHAYPHLLHRKLKERYPFAVLNVIVTAIGGENAVQGSLRFEREVLNHRPDVVTIDYGLNDRRIGLRQARDAWERMIEAGLAFGSKIILLTPTWDYRALLADIPDERVTLEEHAEQIRELAATYRVGLADSYAAFAQYAGDGAGHPADLLSWSNHPNSKGHEIVANLLSRWFM